MAPRKKAGMKEFYSQKKKNSSKQKAEPRGKSQIRNSANKRQGDTIPATYDDANASAGTLGSTVVQPAELKAYGRADYPGKAFCLFYVSYLLSQHSEFRRAVNYVCMIFNVWLK